MVRAPQPALTGQPARTGQSARMPRPTRNARWPIRLPGSPMPPLIKTAPTTAEPTAKSTPPTNPHIPNGRHPPTHRPRPTVSTTGPPKESHPHSPASTQPVTAQLAHPVLPGSRRPSAASRKEQQVDRPHRLSIHFDIARADRWRSHNAESHGRNPSCATVSLSATYRQRAARSERADSTGRHPPHRGEP